MYSDNDHHYLDFSNEDSSDDDYEVVSSTSKKPASSTSSSIAFDTQKCGLPNKRARKRSRIEAAKDPAVNSMVPDTLKYLQKRQYSSDSGVQQKPDAEIQASQKRKTLSDGTVHDGLDLGNPTTSQVINFNSVTAIGQPGWAGVGGLYGCTGVIIVSRKGAYLMKVYEDPTMSASVNQNQDDTFSRQVLGVLANGNMAPGGSFVEGLKAQVSTLFPAGQNTHAYIVSPLAVHESVFQYGEYVNGIENYLRKVLPSDARYTTYGYRRPSEFSGYPGTKDQGALNTFLNRLGESNYGIAGIQYQKTDNNFGWLLEVMNPTAVAKDEWEVSGNPFAR